jgi:hypothetical protein
VVLTGLQGFARSLGNFFGGSLSLGVDNIRFLDCDNGDNGMFVVNEHWEIIKREFFPICIQADKFNKAYYKEVFDECCKKNDAVFEYEPEVAVAA